LPFVGSAHADGHLLGVGVVLSREMTADDQKTLISALDTIADDKGHRGEGLGFDATRFPGLGQWRLVRQGIFDDYRKSLRADTWTASPNGCRHWASVTPFVFDHHGKAKSKADYIEECARLVSDALLRVVIGATVEHVCVTPVSPVTGVPPAYDFPRLKRKDGSERRQIHVEIVFDRPVIGPLLVGAGRFRGYGFCRPLVERDVP
jgi:CRISPR-associated protein Csb2